MSAVNGRCDICKKPTTLMRVGKNYLCDRCRLDTLRIAGNAAILPFNVVQKEVGK